ncbi:SDR family NAD(P)-dependent oxidoreductase [Vibrio sp. PP-XX7]
MGKTALVTGANKGIGLEIARQLGKAGLRIIVAARDRARGMKATQVLQDEAIVAVFAHRSD